MKHLITILFIGLLMTIPSAAWSQPTTQQTPFIKVTKTPKFSLPLDCELDKDCWIINYVDMHPNDDQHQDHQCNTRTYDGHKGTDFAVLDGKTMKQGVPVLAVKDGTVKRIRDGEPDRWPTPEDIEQVKKDRKECGNAVLIDHGDGWETIYCHMKQGSVSVKPNQVVRTGDKIGEVGLSGLTEFPHVHLGIIQEGKILDPFTGLDHTHDCGEYKQSLWNKDINITYQPLIIHATGLQDTVPELSVLEKNITPPETIMPDAEILTGWTILYGAKKDDQITIKIFDPNNKPFVEREIIQDKNRARQFYYAGKKLKGTKLQEGVYTVETTVTRPSQNEEASPQTWHKINTLLVMQNF